MPAPAPLDTLRSPLVREADPADAARIAELYRQLVDNPAIDVRAERIAALRLDPNTALLVCAYAGEVEGTALVSLCADVMFANQPFAVVENIVVSSTLRGQGLGAALLRHIDALCLARDCSKIMVLSASEREAAHRFFERAGYSGSLKRGFVKYRRQLVRPAP